ncbi:single insulin-like growth factor-binding domain protein-2 [Oratosquilla oratoria]|uniref:single insulin-like growth factor-binding domain protein-2 n=1 Tax=Oratosquilla oratoria TaxID=337810 RepID=UPI003F761D42
MDHRLVNAGLCLVAAFVFLSGEHRIDALSCLPCANVTCPRLKKKDCPVGVERDACACCRVCKKNLGEVCGGPFVINGNCGKGLVCCPMSQMEPGKCEINYQRVCKWWKKKGCETTQAPFEPVLNVEH